MIAEGVAPLSDEDLSVASDAVKTLWVKMSERGLGDTYRPELDLLLWTFSKEAAARIK